jgi:hypothetical protein
MNPVADSLICLLGYALTYDFYVDLLYVKLNAYPGIDDTNASPSPKHDSTYTSSSAALVGFIVWITNAYSDGIIF